MALENLPSPKVGANARRCQPPRHWRWMILISKAGGSLITLGLFKTMGVFIPYFVADFRTSVASVGLAVGIYGSLCSIFAPVASAILPYFEPRTLVIAGGAVMTMATAGAPTSSTLLQLTAWLSIASMAEALVLVPSYKPLIDYFPDSFATVNGIAFAAGTFGMMALPPLSQWLIALYGWKGALFILSSVTANLCVTGALLRPLSRAAPARRKRYQRLPKTERKSGQKGTRKSAQDDPEARCCKTVFSVLSERFDLQLFVHEPGFLLYETIFFLSGAVITGWYLFLVPHAEALGYSEQLSSSLSTYGGVGSFAARITNGLLIDKGIIAPDMLFVLASLVLAASSMLDSVLASSFVGLAVLSCVSGIAIGYMYPIPFVIMQHRIAKERQLAALGWTYLAVGMGQVFGGFISGLIVDMIGDYEVVFKIYGGMSIVMVPLMLATRLIINRGPQSEP